MSGNLTAAGVSAGISMSNMSENKTINQPISASHISVSIPKNAIGQSRTFNEKNKVYSTSFIYRASNGKVVYKKKRTIIHEMLVQFRGCVIKNLLRLYWTINYIQNYAKGVR